MPALRYFSSYPNEILCREKLRENTPKRMYIKNAIVTEKVVKLIPDIQTRDEKILFKTMSFLSDPEKALVGYTLPTSYE